MFKRINQEIMGLVILLVVAIQPIFDLDYLIYPFLDKVGIPLPSTILRFVIFPILILISFFLFEKNKKRALLMWGGFFSLVGIYFILHVMFVSDLELFLPPRYYFSTYKELTYVYTMLLPIVMVYVFQKYEYSYKHLKAMILVIFFIVSLPIVIGNLFTFSYSTYEKGVMGDANIFKWFSDGYELFHPRELSSKFFYKEGNAVGALMFLTYPVLYFIFTEEKKKWLYALMLLIQGLAMLMLGTRVATYGAILMSAAAFGGYMFLWIIHKVPFTKSILGVSLFLTVLFYLMLPYTPAIENQGRDAFNDALTAGNTKELDDLRNTVDGIEFDPESIEWNYAAQYIFEQYTFLLTIPEDLYLVYYDYKRDPKFWLDFIFEIPFEDRVNNRQFQNIFYDYKWQRLSTTEKLFGMTYSRFNNGSVVLEQDFVQQYYSFGTFGFILLLGPYIALFLIVNYLFFRHFYQHATFKNVMLMGGVYAGFFSAYTSGHILDQFIVSLYLAFVLGYLYHQLKN